ncbi:hypothetical protein BC941DRAFT_446380 [Chlamydoabsidia padenii]|nr:hypothetical protein BC941DRAFT_446380 [Chlamydoabsidia padenii]
MAIVHEAIYLIQSLVVKGNTDWLHNEKYDPLLKTISSFMKMSRPSEHLELQWYHLKLAAIRTFDRILTIVPVPLSPEDTLELALYPSIYTLNNECLRVQDGNKPPYESVPKNESDILLAEVVSLMYKSLLVHPVLLDYPSNVKGDDDDEDSVYLQTIISLKRLEQIMDLSLEAKRLVRPTLAKLTQLINQKDSLMASAPRSS